VERELEGLTRRQEEVAAALTAAGADHEALAEAGRAAAALDAAVADAERRWLELAEESEGAR
jgi:hypothetical protein